MPARSWTERYRFAIWAVITIVVVAANIIIWVVLHALHYNPVMLALTVIAAIAAAFCSWRALRAAA